MIDSDYRGELGVVLLNFGKGHFVVNMGDKIAQLILRRIKAPLIKETDSLEETGLGNKVVGSTGINSGALENNQDFKTKLSVTE